MRKFIIITTLLCLPMMSFGQALVSGEYNSELKLAHDQETNILTGYFENYTGWDEETKSPRFSCIFYITGKVDSSVVTIDTYYPEDKIKDKIIGSLRIHPDSTISIKLPEEHVGCWNVKHFTDDKAKFSLVNKESWMQIRYIVADKAYFYSEKSIDKKLNTYVVKNDFIYVEKFEGEWAYCTFYGEKNTLGWIRIEDFNNL